MVIGGDESFQSNRVSPRPPEHLYIRNSVLHIYAENSVEGVKVFFFFQLLDEHSNELSGDGSTATLYIFNFGSRAPNAFVADFYF